MKKLIFLLIFLIFASVCYADDVPPNAKLYLPLLSNNINDFWKDLIIKSLLAGQIEQESCISLKHQKCWNPRVQLQTSREYGFGLSQITIAYTKDGKVRFNNFEEIKKLDKRLNLWEFKDRFNPDYQIKALIVYDRNIFIRVNKLAKDQINSLLFMLSAYNGGTSGIINDRKLCMSSVEDDTICNQWFNGIENYSFKSKTKVSGYGKSFFEINREYVSNIFLKRRLKYINHLGS